MRSVAGAFFRLDAASHLLRLGVKLQVEQGLDAGRPVEGLQLCYLL